MEVKRKPRLCNGFFTEADAAQYSLNGLFEFVSKLAEKDTEGKVESMHPILVDKEHASDL